jgi:hypothetical protein
MSKFFEDTMQGLCEAIEVEKGKIPLQERKGMPAPTYYAIDHSNQSGLTPEKKKILRDLSGYASSPIDFNAILQEERAKEILK